MVRSSQINTQYNIVKLFAVHSSSHQQLECEYFRKHLVFFKMSYVYSTPPTSYTVIYFNRI
jgi:hypothetical protein